jgi:hypothetical protein
MPLLSADVITIILLLFTYIDESVNLARTGINMRFQTHNSSRTGPDLHNQ